MGLIFIPKLTKKHLYFLAFSISAFLRDYISFININNYQDKGDKNINEDGYVKYKESPIQKRYFDIITNVLSDCLQGIFVLFHSLKVKKETSDKIENNDNSLFNQKTVNTVVENNSTFSSFCKIMTKICSVDFFCQLIFLIFALIFDQDDRIERKNNNYLLLIDISSRFLFCRIILDTYFYKHHIISMIINMVIFLILGFVDLYYIFFKDYDYKKLMFFFCLIIQTIAYSLEDVYNKVALSRESLTPYSLLFYKGFFQIPLVIITTIIVLPINNVFSDFRKLDSGYQKYVLIRRAVFVVLNILRSIFLVKVIDKFSSQHLSILKVLESIFMFGYFLIDGKYKDDDKQVNEIVYIPIIAVSFIITIITSLIYNEILVINLCGMQEYTQHGLDIQAEKDLRDALTEISDMSNDNSITSDCRSESFLAQTVSYAD